MHILHKAVVASCLCFVPFAPAARAQSLPLATSAQFQIGNHWTWTYYTQGDEAQFYSSERYEVIERAGSNITIEMRTQYEVGGPYTAHTRFRVDLEKCRQAFRRPELRTSFLIALIPRINGQWSSPIATPSTAFEEKFNCNPYVHASGSALYETRFEEAYFEGGQERLFQQWPRSRQSQILSYYFQDHPQLAGVAHSKDFSPGTPHYYRMQLTAWGQAHF